MRLRRRFVAVFLALALALGAAIGQAPAPTWSATGEVRYEARDPLAAWSGVAPIARFDVVLDPADLRTLRLSAAVPTGAFSSGNALRDRAARREVFESEAFPIATLVAVGAAGQAALPLPPSGTVVWLLDADLDLHGVARGYRIEAVIGWTTDPSGAALLQATASFTISLEAHDMRRPALLGLVTDDEVVVRVTATARLDPVPRSTTR